MADSPIVPISSSIGAVAESLVALDNLWDEFLKLRISENTKNTYAWALNDFFRQMTGGDVTPQQIEEFLHLPGDRAMAVVLRYQTLLLDRNLSPNTINTRIAAIKSLVNYARKLEKCRFSLEDIEGLKVEIYRDTTGVDAYQYQKMIKTIDRGTIRGKRDYAIARLLWDNALRRGEIAALSVEDVQRNQLWIKRKGKLQKQAIDLAPPTQYAIEDWLEVRNTDVSNALFIALDRRSYGKRLSGRSIAYLIERLAKDANISKRMSPHRVRHSSITAYLDLSDGNVRDARLLSGHAKLETLVIYDDRRRHVQGQISTKLADLL
jgi:integrase/recombinase XerC